MQVSNTVCLWNTIGLLEQAIVRAVHWPERVADHFCIRYADVVLTPKAVFSFYLSWASSQMNKDLGWLKPTQFLLIHCERAKAEPSGCK